MEATTTSDGQLLITGAGGDQPLIMSAEDAAQFLAQAGLQLADIGESERIIIGDARQDQQELTAESLLASGMEVGTEGSGEINDGTVLYIDPNDPQAAALLQQAGLTLAEDGTVHSIEDVAKMNYENGNENENNEAALPQEYFMQQESSNVKKESINSIVEQHEEEAKESDPNEFMSGIVGRNSNALEEASTLAALSTAQMAPAPARAQTTTVPASAIQVGPDQQQVFYSVTGEDGKTQQYMMLCPKDMDQNTLIQTLVRQISSDPTSRGKKTIRITQQKKPQSTAGARPRVQAVPKVTAVPKGRKPVTAPQAVPRQQIQQQQQQQQLRQQQQKQAQLQAAQQQAAQQQAAQEQAAQQRAQAEEINRKMGEILSDSGIESSNLETMQQEEQQQFLSTTDGLLEMAGVAQTETRVYVRCNYCPAFRSTLNGDTWEGILNHILPVCKEELQTTFYGDLGKHFIRSIRIQVNGKQIMRTESPSGGETNVPQCEVILTHSLVCRKTKREFIIHEPDANFIAQLAKHIRMTQPGQGGRGNSLLCIFCNSPFTFEDYLRHIQPHIEAILATLSCFSGAYCATSYDSLRTTSNCISCQEPEAADLRFLPCTKFSTEYHCLSKLQFGIECFRENYGDNGFMRLNTNHLAKCTVCKNPQQVYCAVFHITSTVLGNSGNNEEQNVDSQLCVCVNCQKQFINIVMKEQGFEERMKIYQLRNMEQLCSCLRVILGQVKAICQDKKTLIYTVHENTSNANSTVHMIKGADVTEVTPVTKMIAMPEKEIVDSPVKAFFVCDLCMFTVDLTALIATPTNRQKSEMLLSIVLEHVNPHTDSLMNVIASSASNRTFNLKFEVSSNVTETPNTVPSQRKIVLSLRKKFHSQLGNGAEVVLDKDEEVTINAIRTAVKSERKSYVSVRGPRGNSTSTEGPETPPTITTTTSAATSQQVEINKFIEKQKSRFGIWSQCGCNTTLLNSYMECRLCSKFCFPDFRLGVTGIEMCENCVETVLTLCLPSEPECLEIPEECLALKDERNVGHRLVLASDLKKWLSLDGVNLIKKTVEEFDRVKASECSTVFSDGIRQHLLAALKTCQNDADITTAVAGFCITDDFLTPAPATTGQNATDSETAAALASLQEQVGVPIKYAEEKKPAKERQIEVKILARRPPISTKKTPIPIRFGSKFGTNFKRVIKNGTVIDLGSPPSSSNPPTPGSKTTSPAGNTSKVIYLNSAKKSVIEDESMQEESVSAIQSFLEETSPEKTTTTIIDGKEVRVPAGIKITSAGKGVVNIRAITDARQGTTAVKTATRIPLTVAPSKTTPSAAVGKKVTSVRGMKGVSMVTLTAGGIIKKVSDAKSSFSSRSDEDDFDDEGDSDDMSDDYDSADLEDMIPQHTVKSFKPAAPQQAKKKIGRPPKAPTSAKEDNDYKPPSGAAVLKGQPKKIPILKQGLALPAVTLPSTSTEVSATTTTTAKDSEMNSTFDDSVASNSGEEPRSKRARKEKKIFDL